MSLFGERRLSWQEVDGAEPGYSGMALFLADGEVLVSGAVQKSNVSTWLNGRTRADVLADLIRTRAAEATAWVLSHGPQRLLVVRAHRHGEVPGK